LRTLLNVIDTLVPLLVTGDATAYWKRSACALCKFINQSRQICRAPSTRRGRTCL